MELCLLWQPEAGWAVYDDCTCPDTGAFPDHFYKKYDIPEENFIKSLKYLVDIRKKLIAESIIPKQIEKENIFPDIKKVLAGRG